MTAPINRRLTDAERDLLNLLAIRVIADQTGVTDQAAADALDDLIERHGLYLEGDAHDVYVKTGTPGDGPNHVLVHVTREWLAFHAEHPKPSTSTSTAIPSTTTRRSDASGQDHMVSGRDTVFPHQLKRDMPVKILTATPVPAPRDDDFCSSVTGEICIPHGLVCTDPEKAARCGCNRTHIGISSREWTTTVKVSATDWTTDQVVGVCMDNLVESYSVEVFGPTTSTT